MTDSTTDLIERLDKLSNHGQTQEDYKTIQEAITALSPVLPPEVDAAIKFYRDPEQGANRITADLLERLWRENEDRAMHLRDQIDTSVEALKVIEQLQQRNEKLSKQHAGAMQYIEGQKIDIEGLQQRIEELEPKYQLERQGSARMSEEILKLESQRDQLAEELEDQLQYHQEEAVTLENRIEEVVAANDKERARVNKLTSQRDQLAEALEALGDEDWWDTETMLSASDYARRQHKRIMGEK